ncbi:MAG TPA: efflux RND transporter periplasmic adaptor subunit [Chthonomonadaceae bacterium]|nr:efflux RND transporter periplasmic adaptor subunit [Chthonomonadaceae bacterium]
MPLKRFLSGQVIGGLLTLVVVFVVVRHMVVTYRRPGAMTVMEAQAMDMSQSGTPLGAAPVAAEPVKARRFAPTVTYTGSVVAFNDTEVYPRVTGVLTALYVYPGQKVRAGQLIAQLDSAELASRLNEAAAASQAAQHELNMSGEERRLALAQERAAEAKAQGLRSALRDAQSQVVSAQVMREEAQREQEAVEASLADAEANVTAMQADADYWRNEITREEKLLGQGVVSREEYEREQSQAKTAQARLTQAQASKREKKATVAAAQSKVRQAEAAIAGAKARADQARADVQGAQADVTAAETTIALNQHHVAHRNAMAAQAAAQEQTARIVHSYTQIRAAQDGVVTERLASPGTLVQPGMALLRIQSTEPIRLQANVAETDLNGMHVGTPVTVTTPRDPSLRLQTRLTSVFNAANAQTRTVTVEALTPNPGSRLVPGQYIVMEIATAPPREALTVPTSAIRHDENQKPYVWTVVAAATAGKPVYTCVMHPDVRSDKPGKCPRCGMNLVLAKRGGKQMAHRVFVSLGVSDGEHTGIESGLDTDDLVIYHGYEYLNEGDPVVPTEWGISGPKALPEPSSEAPSMPGMTRPQSPRSDSSATANMDSMPEMGR